MHAAVLHRLGEAPRYEQFPEPTANSGETIVSIRAAALKPVDKQIAAGSHYASPKQLPVVCGVDGVGHLEDGTRVYFAGPRPPYGAMAQDTVVARQRCFALPQEIDDVTAAAIANPGVSAWLTLSWRARLSRGETVLVLGATGVTGKLAVQTAKLLGAGRVVAAGRNDQVLNTLRDFGADVTIPIDRPAEDLAQSFGQELRQQGFAVIVDYLWGRPTEVLLQAMTRDEFAPVNAETRLVQVGESAGSKISLAASVLRSTALTILGTAGIPPQTVMMEAFEQVIGRAARGELRIDMEQLSLSEVEKAWPRELHGRRLYPNRKF